MHWMEIALHLAENGRRTCPPNPVVGCVIIKNNQIVGQGFHRITGGDHAEIIALREASENAVGASVYLTLEPCTHENRTSVCVNALVTAKVKEVFVAIPDPNPLVSGCGINALKNAGVDVHVGLCQEQAYQQNQDFFHAITKKIPFIVGKWAMTMDGKICNHKGDSQWISSQVSQIHDHQLRSEVCAIMVGGNTFRHDNPQLNVRLENIEIDRQPRPIIVSASGQVPIESKVFEKGRNSILITGKNISSGLLSELDKRGVEFKQFELQDGKFLFQEIFDYLGAQYNFKNVIVEGGAQLLTSIYQEKLFNKIYTYLAPKIMGGKNSKSAIEGGELESMDDIYNLHSPEMIDLSPDVCLVAKTQQTPLNYQDFLSR